MLRKTWPPLAGSFAALLALGLALNRPGERIEVAIDRVLKEPSPNASGRRRLLVEGRVVNPKVTYRRPGSARLVLLRPGTEPSTIILDENTRGVGFDPPDGRFRIEQVVDPRGIRPTDRFALRVTDGSGRTEEWPLPLGP